MKRMTMKLMALALLMVASSAALYAQVAFTTSSLPRQMRSDGITEGAGEVTVTVLGAGGTILLGSSIDIVYSVAITNNSTAVTNNISLANNVTCSGGCPAGMSAGITGSNTVRISFGANAAFAPNATITISRVRVNANAAVGVGAVTATLAGNSPDPANNPITFTNPQVQVGVLNATITVNFNHSSATSNPIALFRTCAFPNDTNSDFFVRITEVFPAAITTGGQEILVSNNQGVDNGSNITITLSNIPAGFDVISNGTILNTGGFTFTATTPTTVSQTTAGSVSFTFAPATTSTQTVERTTFAFALKPTTTSTTNPLAIASVGPPISIQASVSVAPINQPDDVVVRFAQNAIGPTTVATISDCQTRMLLTWVATVADVETGIAIANTSSDDAAFGSGSIFGATSQNGTCTLTGYPSAGGTPVSFTTATINAGSTLAFLMSQTTGFSNFTGYVLVVCNFQTAHAFLFITNGRGVVTGPTLAQGYIANVIPNGTRPGTDTTLTTSSSGTITTTGAVDLVTGALTSTGTLTSTDSTVINVTTEMLGN